MVVEREQRREEYYPISELEELLAGRKVVEIQDDEVKIKLTVQQDGYPRLKIGKSGERGYNGHSIVFRQYHAQIPSWPHKGPEVLGVNINKVIVNSDPPLISYEPEKSEQVVRTIVDRVKSMISNTS